MPNGQEGNYYYCDTQGSVLVIPLWPDGRISLCKQYRYLMKSWVVEFCGGAMSEGETPETAAARELREELGIIAVDFELLGKFNPFKGVTNEVCWVLLCKADKDLEQKLEQSEEIQRIDVDRNDLVSIFSKNELHDGMSLAAIELLRNKFCDL